MKRFAATALIAAALPTTMAQAHPHIFVSVEMKVTYADNVPASVELAWIYDEYFSFLLLSDLGLDLDADMILTPEEEQTLAASITEWPADFGGDLEVTQNGQPVPLKDRINHTMTFKDGIVREIHTRPLGPLPQKGGGLTVQVYDPFYYVAYELVGSIAIEGRDDCEALIAPANLDAAYTLVEELLYGRPASDVDADEEFPEVGVAFADTVQITCAVSG